MWILSALFKFRFPRNINIHSVSGGYIFKNTRLCTQKEQIFSCVVIWCSPEAKTIVIKNTVQQNCWSLCFIMMLNIYVYRETEDSVLAQIVLYQIGSHFIIFSVQTICGWRRHLCTQWNASRFCPLKQSKLIQETLLAIRLSRNLTPLWSEPMEFGMQWKQLQVFSQE
jgi:hypothetical protein